jgi:hypothetical protein
VTSNFSLFFALFPFSLSFLFNFHFFPFVDFHSPITFFPLAFIYLPTSCELPSVFELTMVITRGNQTAQTDSGLAAQGNAGDHLMSTIPPKVDLSQRAEQLTSLM